MGVTNQFEEARALIAQELHFAIGGEASEFRSALDRAGSKRLKHCVTLVAMWARAWHKGAAKYEHLMKLLRLVTPEKTPGTKYRDSRTDAAMAQSRALDDELGEILRREEQSIMAILTET